MINYDILAHSIKHYESNGFVRIESPWTITEQVSSITKPPGKLEFKLVHDDGKVLVASGEQSFLYLYLKGFLPKGRFQTTTPCFRRESFDSQHSKYFIKNELIDTENVTDERLKEIVEIAFEFFALYFPRQDLKITGNGITSYPVDIEYKGVELGRYGIRSCDYLEWIYATGCAEPRLSSTLKKFELQKREEERVDNF